jgi:hypothetical protein
MAPEKVTTAVASGSLSMVAVMSMAELYVKDRQRRLSFSRNRERPVTAGGGRIRLTFSRPLKRAYNLDCVD